MSKFLIAFILLILFWACKKDNPQPQPQVIVTSSTSRTASVTPGTTYDNVSISPNPASNQVYIQFQTPNANSSCIIKIIAGKYSETVYNQQSSSGNVTVSLLNFPEGIALIQVVMDSKLWEYNLIIQ